MVRADPVAPLKGHKPLEARDQTPEYNVTELSNGFTVVTESQVFPGPVHMGFLIKVGTRDETAETSGACLALKNTYLKTLKHTNETINYGMIQMSGGKLEMDYGREFTYFKGNCIEYDVIDMFQLLVDVALEPRSVLAANVAKAKNRKSHDLYKHLHRYDPSSENHELLLRTAYGYNTLGMPSNGMEGNVENIDARMLQQFVMDNVTPSKCYIVASGVKNHKEYVDLVRERLGELLPVPEHQHERQTSEYIGGEYRTWTESPLTHIHLAFPSVSYNDPDASAYYVMNQLLGNSDASTPGQGVLSRAVTNLVKKQPYVHQASGIHSTFTDSGLFGIQVQGAGSHSQDLMQIALEELNKLKSGVSDEELQRAKNQLKMDVLSNLNSQEGRLEELAHNIAIYGDLVFHKYTEQIDAVTSD